MVTPDAEWPGGLDPAFEGYRPPELSAEEAGEAPILDAWFASYDDPGIEGIATLQGIPELSGLEKILGADTRQRVSDTTIKPFKWVAMLEIDAPTGTRWHGTGWLASSSLVVTAGHCVYMHKEGGWASRIRVRLGVKADDNRKIVAEAAPVITANRGFRSVAGWVRDEDPEADYGAIILPKLMPKEYGHFLYEARSDSVLSKQLFNIDGYPGDKPLYTQWFNVRESAVVSTRLLKYPFDTYYSQSGAPVWDYDGDRVVLGIHTRGGDLSNHGIRITEDVATNISRWSNGEK